MIKKEIKKIVNSIQKTPLFQQAFTHVSLTNETQKKVPNYETLELLGDSILDMQVCLYIYFNYPHYSEGQMSNLKKLMVREKTLAMLSKEIGFSNFLKLGVGEKKNKNKQKISILADVFESFIAVLYLEKGSVIVKKFLDLTLFTWLKGKEELVWDYKSQLQEICQAQNNLLFYRTTETKNKQFISKVFDAKGNFCARGQGKNKKEAQQEAARLALAQISNH